MSRKLFFKLNKGLVGVRKGKIEAEKKIKSFSKFYFKDKTIFEKRTEGFECCDRNLEFKVDGLNSKFLYRHVVRVGSRPQNVSRCTDQAANFHLLVGHNFSRNYKPIADIDVANSYVVNGCFQTNKVTLQRTMIPSSVDVKSSPPAELSKRQLVAVKAVIRKLKIVKLGERNVHHLYNNTFNPKTSPGFRFNSILNLKDKEEASEVAYMLALKRWNYIESCSRRGVCVERSRLSPSIYSIGARNKRDHTYDDNDDVTSRAVHMPEFHNEICSAPWIDRISEMLKDEARGPLYLGNSIVYPERLKKDVSKAKFCLEGDWKRFDSSLYIESITICVAIARLFYVDGIRGDNHFTALYDTVAIKDYITPGGDVFRLYHGLPSGVKGTSLLGSILNLYSLCYCLSDFKLSKFSFVVGGDDFLILSNHFDLNLRHEIKRKISSRSEDLCMIFKFLKIKLNFSYRSIRFCPTFYKYTIFKGNAITMPETIYERMLLPWNKKYRDCNEIFKFLIELLSSIGKPMSHCLPIYIYIVSTYASLIGGSESEKKRLTVSEVFKIHEYIYENMDFRSLLPINIEYKKMSYLMNLSVFYGKEYKDKNYIKKRDVLNLFDFF